MNVAFLFPRRELRRLRADRDELLQENAALGRALLAERAKYLAAVQALRHYMPDHDICVCVLTTGGDHVPTT